jgi:SAM-dependent methyltransferase
MNVISFACPTCRVSLQVDQSQYHCSQCGRRYSSRLDIPSLVTADIQPDPREQDLIERLCLMYPTATVEEMSKARLAIGATNEELRQLYANYHRTLRQRGPAFLRMFQGRAAQVGWNGYDRHIALDIGCGIGGGVLALAREFEQVVGLDISLSSLIIARKVIEEAGLKNVTLVHASAHQLPCLAGSFDFAMAINVLEHIFTPERMLSEVRRVLAARGVFAGDSRNRFDLFFKEPHVGLRWVGMLPRRWMARYVRWRIGVDYAATHTYLLSYRDLSHALQAAFGAQWCIALPDAAAYGAAGAAGDLAERINQTGVLRALAARIAPSHIVLAQRM